MLKTASRFSSNGSQLIKPFTRYGQAVSPRFFTRFELKRKFNRFT